MFIVGLPKLDNLEFLFERNADWTRAFSAFKPKLQKEWELLQGELPRLKMNVPIDSLRLVNFESAVIMKN